MEDIKEKTADEKNEVCVNYEREYYRQQELIKKLYAENEKYKQALLNVCVKLLGDE